MQIAKNIKKLRDEKDLMQKEVARFFGLSIDELVHSNGKMTKAITVEYKTTWDAY